ncbi:hypothetical protein DDB_G0271554 [Dictyostelium discoideum AX4]|uniref:Putative uncharacterized protein DDB_G0271554 n=1 Tax=Dictyostelium discoideum TaxID=44689 RepID=Y8418_DICDI|nr:hypothetical protein DDB_G0271554 [Dictyostelium discoideum AX4]Q86JG2.1 RecName: Full=Putative uncharacterized protein DDB_G0271554 [Dictyostelium discoideum]EAL71641.1 hypothetical protein DDB_G0271554 [Dictyostelium discoideum AX4]|eukprot:XP_645598.1 hypothetical protein DDB_G0271554 [Dictyostelium discoideum AX4]
MSILKTILSLGSNNKNLNNNFIINKNINNQNNLFNHNNNNTQGWKPNYFVVGTAKQNAHL